MHIVRDKEILIDIVYNNYKASKFVEKTKKDDEVQNFTFFFVNFLWF